MPTLHQLGDPRLDDDHQELERLIDAVADAAADALLAAFDAMHAHAAQHFATEDEELREMKDGNATCHLDEHAAVLKSFGEVREVIGTDPGSAVAERLITSLVLELRRWLPEHVQAMDAAVAHSRTRRRLGGAPVVIAGRALARSD